MARKDLNRDMYSSSVRTPATELICTKMTISMPKPFIMLISSILLVLVVVMSLIILCSALVRSSRNKGFP